VRLNFSWLRQETSNAAFTALSLMFSPTGGQPNVHQYTCGDVLGQKVDNLSLISDLH
jgi:hypothetical protein